MVRADQGELTKLPGIATLSSLVSLGVVSINNELRTTSGHRVLGCPSRHSWRELGCLGLSVQREARQAPA